MRNMKSIKAIFRRGQSSKGQDGQNGEDISRSSSVTNLNVDQKGSKGAKPRKAESRDWIDVGTNDVVKKKLITKNNNKEPDQERELVDVEALQKQLAQMANEKSNLALQLGEQTGQLNSLQSEVAKWKVLQEQSNQQVDQLLEENSLLRNRLKDVSHSPLSDTEKQQLLFESHRYHSSAPASFATNLIDHDGGDVTACPTPEWDKQSSGNVSEVSVACLQDKINQMQETHYSTNEELQATLQELTDLQRQLTELQQENERLIEEKNLMFESLCRQTERLNDSRNEVESLKQLLHKDDHNQFETAAEREQKLVDLLKSAQEEREALIVKQEQLGSDLEDSRSVNLHHNDAIVQLKERVKTLQSTLDAKHAEHKLLDQELALAKDQSSGRQIEINRLKDLLENARTKIGELEQDRALGDKSELDELLDNARKEKDSLESEVAHLKEQLAISKNEADKLREQVSILQEECKVTRNNAKTTQSDLEYKCERLILEKAALADQLAQFQDAVNELQVQTQCHLDDKRQLSAVLSETQRNLNESERKVAVLEGELSEVKRLRQEQEEEWEKFQNDLLTSVRVANDFKTEAQQDLQKLIMENKTERERVRQLEAQIDKLKGVSGGSLSSKPPPPKRREKKSSNKPKQRLSKEEEILLDNLDKLYEQIDPHIPEHQLTEEQRVVKKLKRIYDSEELKQRPKAPKSKSDLAISKPLLDSVISNPKLGEIANDPRMRNVERFSVNPDDFSELEAKRGTYLQIPKPFPKVQSEVDLFNRVKRGNSLLKTRSMEDLSPATAKKGGMKRYSSTEDLSNIFELPRLRKKDSSVTFETIEQIVSGINPTIPEELLTKEQRLALRLKQVLDKEGEGHKLTLKKDVKIGRKQIDISAPTRESVEKNEKLGQLLNEPIPSHLSSKHSSVRSKRYDEITFTFDNSKPINMYSDDDTDDDHVRKNRTIPPPTSFRDGNNTLAMTTFKDSNSEEASGTKQQSFENSLPSIVFGRPATNTRASELDVLTTPEVSERNLGAIPRVPRTTDLLQYENKMGAKPGEKISIEAINFSEGKATNTDIFKKEHNYLEDAVDYPLHQRLVSEIVDFGEATEEPDSGLWEASNEYITSAYHLSFKEDEDLEEDEKVYRRSVRRSYDEVVKEYKKKRRKTSRTNSSSSSSSSSHSENEEALKRPALDEDEILIVNRLKMETEEERPLSDITMEELLIVDRLRQKYSDDVGGASFQEVLFEPNSEKGPEGKFSVQLGREEFVISENSIPVETSFKGNYVETGTTNLAMKSHDNVLKATEYEEMKSFQDALVTVAKHKKIGTVIIGGDSSKDNIDYTVVVKQPGSEPLFDGNTVRIADTWKNNDNSEQLSKNDDSNSSSSDDQAPSTSRCLHKENKKKLGSVHKVTGFEINLKEPDEVRMYQTEDVSFNSVQVHPHIDKRLIAKSEYRHVVPKSPILNKDLIEFVKVQRKESDSSESSDSSRSNISGSEKKKPAFTKPKRQGKKESKGKIIADSDKAASEIKYTKNMIPPQSLVLPKFVKFNYQLPTVEEYFMKSPNEAVITKTEDNSRFVVKLEEPKLLVIDQSSSEVIKAHNGESDCSEHSDSSKSNISGSEKNERVFTEPKNHGTQQKKAKYVTSSGRKDKTIVGPPLETTPLEAINANFKLSQVQAYNPMPPNESMIAVAKTVDASSSVATLMEPNQSVIDESSNIVIRVHSEEGDSSGDSDESKNSVSSSEKKEPAFPKPESNRNKRNKTTVVGDIKTNYPLSKIEGYIMRPPNEAMVTSTEDASTFVVKLEVPKQTAIDESSSEIEKVQNKESDSSGDSDSSKSSTSCSEKKKRAFTKPKSHRNKNSKTEVVDDIKANYQLSKVEGYIPRPPNDTIVLTKTEDASTSVVEFMIPKQPAPDKSSSKIAEVQKKESDSSGDSDSSKSSTSSNEEKSRAFSKLESDGKRHKAKVVSDVTRKSAKEERDCKDNVPSQITTLPKVVKVNYQLTKVDGYDPRPCNEAMVIKTEYASKYVVQLEQPKQFAVDDSSIKVTKLQKKDSDSSEDSDSSKISVSSNEEKQCRPNETKVFGDHSDRAAGEVKSNADVVEHQKNTPPGVVKVNYQLSKVKEYNVKPPNKAMVTETEDVTTCVVKLEEFKQPVIVESSGGLVKVEMKGCDSPSDSSSSVSSSSDREQRAFSKLNDNIMKKNKTQIEIGSKEAAVEPEEGTDVSPLRNEVFWKITKAAIEEVSPRQHDGPVIAKGEVFHQPKIPITEETPIEVVKIRKKDSYFSTDNDSSNKSSSDEEEYVSSNTNKREKHTFESKKYEGVPERENTGITPVKYNYQLPISKEYTTNLLNVAKVTKIEDAFSFGVKVDQQVGPSSAAVVRSLQGDPSGESYARIVEVVKKTDSSECNDDSSGSSGSRQVKICKTSKKKKKPKRGTKHEDIERGGDKVPRQILKKSPAVLEDCAVLNVADSILKDPENATPISDETVRVYHLTSDNIDLKWKPIEIRGASGERYDTPSESIHSELDIFNCTQLKNNSMEEPSNYTATKNTAQVASDDTTWSTPVVTDLVHAKPFISTYGSRPSNDSSSSSDDDHNHKEKETFKHSEAKEQDLELPTRSDSSNLLKISHLSHLLFPKSFVPFGSLDEATAYEPVYVNFDVNKSQRTSSSAAIVGSKKPRATPRVETSKCIPSSDEVGTKNSGAALTAEDLQMPPGEDVESNEEHIREDFGGSIRTTKFTIRYLDKHGDPALEQNAKGVVRMRSKKRASVNELRKVFEKKASEEASPNYDTIDRIMTFHVLNNLPTTSGKKSGQESEKGEKT